MPPKQVSRIPWVVSGFLVHAMLEVVGIVYAFVKGRVPDVDHATLIYVMLTIGVGLFGAALGLIFASIHYRFDNASILVKGIVFFVLESVILQLIVQGPSSLLTLKTLLSLVVSVGLGAIFVFVGLRLGGY